MFQRHSVKSNSYSHHTAPPLWMYDLSRPFIIHGVAANWALICSLAFSLFKKDYISAYCYLRHWVGIAISNVNK